MKSLIPILIALVFGSDPAHAQSGLEVREDELLAASLEQMAEEARAEKISQLFEKLSSANSIEVTLQSGYHFASSSRGLLGSTSITPVSITFNDGTEIAGDATLAGGKTACLAILRSSAGKITLESGSRIKASLDSLDRFDLIEQKVFAATWKGSIYSPKGQVLASATLECGIGWASFGGLISQPEELSPQVLQYNLGAHARTSRRAVGE